MQLQASAGTFETLFRRLKQESQHYADQVMRWFQHRNDGELIVLTCVFILLLMCLITYMSYRGKSPGSTGRQFGSSIVLVTIVAFGLGLMIDTGAGSLSFLFQ